VSNQIFIELYVDEDVSVLIAELLRARGFVVRTTLEAGKLGCTDREQLEYAVNNKLALLTHNRADFERLAQEYFSLGIAHSGIIIAVRRRAGEITRRLLPVLNSRTRDEIQNQLLYI
jgi:predicted nuclease of predicted toxin-antitoxin system